MKKYILILISVFLGIKAYTQEYIVTSYNRTNDFGTGVPVVLLRPNNPDLESYNNLLSVFFDDFERPLLLQPEGTVFSLKDGLFGKSIADIQEKRDAELIRRAENAITFEAPILSDHPAISNITANGLFYRLKEEDVVKLFFVRSPDFIASQVSAHDKTGAPIIRTIDLKTGEDETVDIRKLYSAKKFQDLASSSRKETNKVLRAKNKK